MSEKSRIDVLIVDDRPENLMAVEAVLACDDYNLIKAESGSQALRYLLDHECAIILMDVQMPEMDGYETARIIKQSERYRDIPIIFLTALNKEERFLHQGYRSGAVDYLFKPLDEEILRSKVAVFADLFRKSQEIKRQAELLREADRREGERELARLELKSLRREQASQRKYRYLVDNLHNAVIWSAEPETMQFTFVSPSAGRILGYPPEDWVGEADFLVAHSDPADRRHVRDKLRLAISQHAEVHLEHRVLDPEGRPRWLQTSVRALPKGEGAEGQYELQGLSVDITALKEAEAALQWSETRSRILAAASLLMSQSLDYETTLEGLGRLAVQEFADWYSVDTRDESGAIGALACAMSAERGTPEDARKLRERYTGLAEVSSWMADVEHGARPFVAHRREHLVSALTVPLSVRGRVTGFLSFARLPNVDGSEDRPPFDAADLTLAEDFAARVTLALENVRLYQAARLAIEARDEFLSIASHELKTPLTPLRLQTQAVMRLMKNRSLADIDPERLLKMVQTSDRQIMRISQLIEDLLDVSRINGGRLNFELEEFDLGELVHEVVERFATQIQAEGCSLELELQEVTRGKWDRFRVEQVVVNLLTNAIKYGAGKPIKLSIGNCPDGVAIEVRDHGIGIDKADQERIFRRFERAVSSANFGGLGLGLFIVSEILRAHGGRIEVESVKDQGSVFRAILPTDAAGALRTEPITAKPEKQAAGGSGTA